MDTGKRKERKIAVHVFPSRAVRARELCRAVQLSRRTCIQREVIKMESGWHLHVYSTSLIPVVSFSTVTPPLRRRSARDRTRGKKIHTGGTPESGRAVARKPPGSYLYVSSTAAFESSCLAGSRPRALEYSFSAALRTDLFHFRLKLTTHVNRRKITTRGEKGAPFARSRPACRTQSCRGFSSGGNVRRLMMHAN